MKDRQVIERMPGPQARRQMRTSHGTLSSLLVGTVALVGAVLVAAVLSTGLSSFRAAQQPPSRALLAFVESTDGTGAVFAMELGTTQPRLLAMGASMGAGINEATGEVVVHLADKDQAIAIFDRNFNEVRRFPVSQVAFSRPPGLRSVLPDRSGRTVFVAHLETIIGDTRGSLRQLLRAYDIETGAVRGSVDLGHCGPVSLHQGLDTGLLWVTCHDASTLRGFDTATWQSVRTVLLPASPTPGGSTVAAEGIPSGVDQFIAITRDLRLVSVDLRTGVASTDDRWATESGSVLPQQIALSPDGRRVWVITGEPTRISSGEGERLTLLDRGTGERRDTSAPGSRALAIIQDEIVYSTFDRVQSLTGTIIGLPSVSLGPEPRLVKLIALQ